ncbi:MAG: hypothetical protein ACLP9L_02960 [Thermoguttaceae bacterium]
MRRHLLGLIALTSLVSAAVLYGSPYQTAGTIGLRIGLVLGALWLAWPDLHRLPRWVWYVLPIGFVVFTYARTYLVFLIPVFAVATILYVLYRKVRGPSR